MNAPLRAWERFWFEPTSTSTLGIVRIAFGIVAFGWTASLAPDLMTFFSQRGLLPAQPSRRWWVGVLSPGAADWAVYLLFAVTLLASACLIIGYHARLASLIVFVGILSFERRNPFIFNAGDVLVRNLAFYVMLAPTGAALSLDRWRKARDRFWQAPKRAPWALRLIQVQLSVVYAATVWAKVRGGAWNNGTAVSFALRLTDLERFRAPSFLSESIVASNLMTFGTLALETALAILVWNRRARPWVLAGGIVMHLLIAINIMVGFFSLAMFVCYLAFTPPETTERVLARVTGRLGTSRLRFLRRFAPAGDAVPLPE